MSESAAAQEGKPTPEATPPWIKWADSAKKGYPHTVTFYSFKGGVGRTLALLNVAVFLAKKGNRVCIADFDLEAPGVDSYPGFEPPDPNQPGMVEFISDYLDRDKNPKMIASSVLNYIYECKLEGLQGPLWVMRAGRQDDAYRKKLAALDLDKLFREQNGCDLFDNLKGELFDERGCNFLLLDSRTGLTDVAGLCTGILPDAVVLMFYPDTQNIRGIETVARAIKRHSDKEGKRIDRMYCVSRVPDIDKTEEAAEECLQKIAKEVEGLKGLLRLDITNPNEITYTQTDELTNEDWSWESLVNLTQHWPNKLTNLSAFDLCRFSVEIGGESIEGPLRCGGIPVCLIKERRHVEQPSPGVHKIVNLYEPIATFAACGNLFSTSAIVSDKKAVILPGEAPSTTQIEQRPDWKKKACDYAAKWYPQSSLFINGCI